MLAQALSGTGLAGRPFEYFNAIELGQPKMREILGDSTLVDGLPKILAAGSTPNGTFAAKIHWSHFRHLGMRITGEWQDSERRAMNDLLRSQLPNLLSLANAHALLRSRFSDLRLHTLSYALLQSRLPDLRVIWLRRQNMVARAISHFRARETGIWYQPASNGGTIQGRQLLGFDLAEIHLLHCIGTFQEDSWQHFFREHKIYPCHVSYEELIGDYESTVRRVLEFLDIKDERALIPPPRSAKQSDALSEEWEERYRRLSAEAGL